NDDGDADAHFDFAGPAVLAPQLARQRHLLIAVGRFHEWYVERDGLVFASPFGRVFGQFLVAEQYQPAAEVRWKLAKVLLCPAATDVDGNRVGSGPRVTNFLR